MLIFAAAAFAVTFAVCRLFAITLRCRCHDAAAATAHITLSLPAAHSSLHDTCRRVDILFCFLPLHFCLHPPVAFACSTIII